MKHSARIDWIAILTVGTVSVLLVLLVIVRRPDLVFTVDYLTGDQGVHLLLGHLLSGGATLYRDINSPYGLAPAFLLAAVDQAVGLSARSYVALLVSLNTAFLLVLTQALRRYVSRRVTLAVMLLGILPFTLTPGAASGGYTNNDYIGLERLILAMLLLGWTPPIERSTRRSVAVGFLFGAWQLVKFGGAIFGLAAWVLLDVLAWWQVRSKASVRRLLSTVATIVGVAALVEASRWLLLFAWLPAPIAFDVAWPAYTARLYQIARQVIGWPMPTALEFITQWALPALAAVTAVVVLVSRAFASGQRHLDRLGLLFLPTFFVVASFLYLGHIHTFRQYAWCLIPALALPAKRSFAALAVLVALPAAAVVVRTAAVSRPNVLLQPTMMTNGDRLWMDAAHRQAAPSVLEEVYREPGTFLMPAGGGMYFYADVIPPTRHAWFLPAYVRPYDLGEIRRRVVARHRFFVLDTSLQTDGDARRSIVATLDGVDVNQFRLSTLAPGWWVVTN